MNRHIKKPTYRIDQLVSGQWIPVLNYPHTEQGLDESFQIVDIFIADKIGVRVIDTSTGKMIMEANP